MTSDNASFDELVLKKHLSIKGCRAPYMKPANEYPQCDSQEKIRDCIYTYQNFRKNYYANACQRLSKVRLSMQGYLQSNKYKRQAILVESTQNSTDDPLSSTETSEIPPRD